ncbi:MAG: ArsR family transcriptional regulator, arsenate/arsenite/antimonite-responsive transcriptional [Acidobacteriota bacterium]|nr:ArsR family transcriptional regulator, arsenate/arsenite/antimonite-responsive transcriptional [Acidobacteriota bacterium]
MVEKIEKINKALGDKNRLRIIYMLSQKPMCVCEITEVLQLSQSTVSGHLRVLKDAELVEDSKDGLWVEYRLCQNDGFLKDLLNLISGELNCDPEMEKDRQLAAHVNRETICKK